MIWIIILLVLFITITLLYLKYSKHYKEDDYPVKYTDYKLPEKDKEKK